MLRARQTCVKKTKRKKKTKKKKRKKKKKKKSRGRSRKEKYEKKMKKHTMVYYRYSLMGVLMHDCSYCCVRELGEANERAWGSSMATSSDGTDTIARRRTIRYRGTRRELSKGIGISRAGHRSSIPILS